MKCISYSLEEVNKAVKWILENVESKVVLFHGEMGVGKTTLIKSIIKELGITQEISSPTYAIVNEYEIENDIIYHFDCYRLKSAEEALTIGIEEYLDTTHWVFIEWPNVINELVPLKHTTLQLVCNEDNTRTLKIMPVNNK